MQPLQRTAVRSARLLRPQAQRQCRRNASGVQPPEHTPPKTHGSHDHGPANESFGSGFFIALAAIPVAIAAISYTREGQAPYFTRVIVDTYDDYKTKWAQRNDLHTQMIEQAASDRTLFLNEGVKPIPPIRYPEQFNHGSPWNVGAGQGSINLEKVIEKYEKEAQEEQAKRLQQVRENKVPAEQPVQRLIRRAPAPSN